MTTTIKPTEPGNYEFKGVLWSNSEYMDPVEFNEFYPAVVFMNETTQRLNMRVTKPGGGDCADALYLFKGEWRIPYVGEGTSVKSEHQLQQEAERRADDGANTDKTKQLELAIDALKVSHTCILLFQDLVKGYAISTALGVGALETIEKVIPELLFNRSPLSGFKA